MNRTIKCEAYNETQNCSFPVVSFQVVGPGPSYRLFALIYIGTENQYGLSRNHFFGGMVEDLYPYRDKSRQGYDEKKQLLKLKRGESNA